MKFGKLTTINKYHKLSNHRVYWICLCDCNDEKSVKVSRLDLLNGVALDCRDCRRKEIEKE